MSDSAESWELTQGALINGKYRIERVIGRGAMGLVLAATDLRLGRRVALKFLLPAVASNPELRARFTREAQSAARLRNQHVVSIFGVEESGEGQPFIVMEYLDGEDLATLLARRGRLPVDAAVEYVLQTCEALSEAHALGIVHRDLKPANLFRTRHPDGSPWIKVCDFGIAKSAFGDTPHLTKTGEFIGTPQYSAPEQLRSSGAVDQRADIWSLGAILFEMLAGRPPFQGDSLQHLAAQVCHTDPPELGGVRPDVPVGLRQVVSSCLRRDLDSRVLDVAEVAERLRPYAPPDARPSADRIMRMANSLRRRDSGEHASSLSVQLTPSPPATRTRAQTTSIEPIGTLLTRALLTRRLPAKSWLGATLLAGGLVLAGVLLLRWVQHESVPVLHEILHAARTGQSEVEKSPLRQSAPPASTGSMPQPEISIPTTGPTASAVGAPVPKPPRPARRGPLAPKLESSPAAPLPSASSLAEPELPPSPGLRTKLRPLDDNPFLSPSVDGANRP